MRKSRKAWLLLSASAVTLPASLWFAFAGSEPHYQGRSLTSWLNQYQAAIAETKFSTEDWLPQLPTIPRHAPEPALVPAQAVSHMGSPALPLLVKWISFRPSPWKVRLAAYTRKLPNWLQQSGPIKSLAPDAGYRRLDLALSGLVILKTNAITVIPDLAKVAFDPTAPGAAYAIRALIEIGEPAVPALTNLLTSAQPEHVKEGIRMGLGKIGAAASIQALILDMQNPNMMAAGQSAAMLGKIGQQPESVVPALTAALDDPRWFMRQCAAAALGRFGPAALPAVPKLKSLLGSDVYLVDDAARHALRQIAPDALNGAPEWSRPVNIAPRLITPLPSSNP